MRTLTRRFGAEWTADFRLKLRQGWIKAEDLATVRACGFNTVRIPFDSRPLIHESGPVVVEEAGFAGLDAALASEALAKLPLEQREVIVAHLWGGLTFEQIAELTGGSAATAWRRYGAGLAELRTLMGIPCKNPQGK